MKTLFYYIESLFLRLVLRVSWFLINQRRKRV
jgi:hypothetical protein